MSETVTPTYTSAAFQRHPTRHFSSHTEPIDLTLEDDGEDDDEHMTQTIHKRPRFERSVSSSSSASGQTSASQDSRWGNSAGFSLNRAKEFDNSSHGRISSPIFNLSRSMALGSTSPHPSHGAIPYRQQNGHSTSNSPMSTPSLMYHSPRPGGHFIPPTNGHGNAPGSQVIDLTSSPSPPPSHMQSNHSNLPHDLPMKAPVCIGQLAVTALVLYPISYLRPHDHGGHEAEWAPVRVQHEHIANKPSASRETIHIKSPNWTTAAGEIVQGEAFGVVEQKVANIIGPMLGKGLIRLEGKVRKGLPNLPILPLQMLVYTPRGNINIVGKFLHEQGLLLDHPSPPYDLQRMGSHYYHNPHNPPPGGYARALLGPNGRVGPLAAGLGGRWTTPQVSGKSVEVQRSQAEELFKSLKSGDELEETEPTSEVATTLYPHQKKALTFLLERERERLGADGSSSSLWQARQNPFSGQASWHHLVTQKEIFKEPYEAKGAILADDMGLGKTITCVSLIAATLDAAGSFAASPLPPPPPPPMNQDSSLSAAHFVGSIWGMPDTSSSPAPSPTPTSAKGKAKAAKEADRAEAEYVRACRVKIKSRATLIVCPLSTISNWEDQLREHWAGEVTVVGGGGCPAPATAGSARPASALSSMGPLTQSLMAAEGKIEPVPIVAAPPPPPPRIRTGKPCRVYVYHGNARRPDPAFLADFDAVITTYATLATEFSKQSKSVASNDADDDEDDNFIEQMVEVDEMGQVVKVPQAKRGVKRKKGPPCGSEASSPLQSVFWFRVVLDEAHSIKETGTVACRACCDLMADRRLCLTGTPVQNKLDDVFALIKFLRLEPFDDKATWTEFIGNPVKYGQSLGVARLQTIMKCITLRRTKETRAPDGAKILSLPPRRDELRYLKFDTQEQTIYDQFFKESKAEFAELSDKNEVMKNYVGILQKILRLRQICDHYELVEGKSLLIDGAGASTAPTYEDIVSAVETEGFTSLRAAAIFTFIRESAAAQCVVCGCELCTPAEANAVEGGDVDAPAPPTKRGRKPKGQSSKTNTRPSSPVGVRPILTRCQHLFCPDCFRSSTFPAWPDVASEIRRPCCICQLALGASDAFEVSTECTFNEPSSKKKGKREKKPKSALMESFHPSTKIKALLGDLIHFSKTNPHSSNYDPSSIEIQMVDDQGNEVDEGPTKTVVFSQWTSMLDKIEDALDAANIRYDRLDGTMRRDERTRAMDALKHDPGCEVLLVSLKAGGVGLNLTAAQRVYLMDPYWNPAVENQAVDRIHRLGQTRPVTTVKLIIENSIEARLLEVQAKKTALANMTLSQNFSKAEMLQRRMEELSQLFGN